jgi:ribosomal protein S18 acetylase RimI-like enzyme
LEIREASGAVDMDTVRALFVEYGESLGFDLDFQGFDRELGGLPGEYAPPGGCILLAQEGSEPFACAALRDLGEGICEMKRLYVRPGRRRSGAGRALAERIVAAARERGYGTMRLDTLASMKAANNLYRSMGFVEIEPYRFNPISDAVYLELDLSGGDG